jgi:hypothetical protein
VSVSASKSALLLSPCLRWAWEGAKPYEDEFADTTKRDKGTNFHKCMETYYSVGELNALDVVKPGWGDVAEWVCLAISWSEKHLHPRLLQSEPAPQRGAKNWSLYSEVYIAYNFSTGETHFDGAVKDRQYPKMPDYLPGTADLVCILSDGSLLVADWKTGGGTGADKQLLTLALGLRNVFRTPSGELRPIRLAILYVSDDGVHPVEWVVTESDLLAHQHAMAFQLADVGVRKDPVPGIHCSQLYCDHLAYCPGIAKEVDNSSEEPEGLLAASSLVRKYSIQEAPRNAEHAGYIMARVTAAKRQMAFYEERIRKYALSGGKVIADGFEYSKGKDGFRWRTIKVSSQ